MKSVITSLQPNNVIFGPLTNFSGNTKTVAICYLTEPFYGKFKRDIPPKNNIINIVGAFIDLGYCVTVIDHKNGYRKIKESQKFDVIFGFGNSFHTLSQYNSRSDTVKIFYYTELSEKYNVRLERDRTIKLREIGYTVTNRSLRAKVYYKDVHAEFADAMLLTGASYQLKHFSHLNLSQYSIQPSSVLDTSNTEVTRSLCRQNDFIWLGSNGGVIKGLDVLIESFAQLPKQKLFLFGLSGNDKKTFLKYSYPNIVDCGFHNPKSQTVKRIAESCKFVISTSFSEGSTTGILTGMGYGCVPIITEFCGTEISNDTQAIVIPEVNVSSLTKIIKDVIESEITYDHSKIAAYALKTYSAESFKKRFTSKIMQILND